MNKIKVENTHFQSNTICNNNIMIYYYLLAQFQFPQTTKHQIMHRIQIYTKTIVRKMVAGRSCSFCWKLGKTIHRNHLNIYLNKMKRNKGILYGMMFCSSRNHRKPNQSIIMPMMIMGQFRTKLCLYRCWMFLVETNGVLSA